jgi:hypothetical protein
MPQPIAHNFVCERAVTGSSLGPQFWESFGNFAGFGSFSPDLFYIEEFTAGKAAYGHAADDMHKDGTLDCYCAMLDAIKALAAPPAQRDRVKAFAYGFYAHVVTDCIFHPFVYRVSGDNWLIHPQDQYTAHKTLESRIDNYLLALRMESDPAYTLSISVDCDAPLSEDLNHHVHDVFKDALVAAYASGRMNSYVYGRLGKDRAENPVQKGYRGYFLANGFNFAFLKRFRKNVMNLEDVRPAGEWSDPDLEPMNIAHSPWSTAPGNASLNYSVGELFNKAVAAVGQVIEASEAFLASQAPSSRDVLLASTVRYLRENMNIDTGLPASLNDDPGNRSDTDAVRFAAGVDFLETSLG